MATQPTSARAWPTRRSRRSRRKRRSPPSRAWSTGAEPGAHDDMDLELLLASAASLHDGFAQMAEAAEEIGCPRRRAAR